MRRIDCINDSVRPRSVWYRQFAEYLQDDLDDVIASFDDVAVGCHSAGCTPTPSMSLERVDEIKVRQHPYEAFHGSFVVVVLDQPLSDCLALQAMVNLEPVSGEIRVEQPEHFLPSINLGAEFANMSCSFPGVDFITWYTHLECPRIILEAAVGVTTFRFLWKMSRYRRIGDV